MFYAKLTASKLHVAVSCIRQQVHLLLKQGCTSAHAHCLRSTSGFDCACSEIIRSLQKTLRYLRRGIHPAMAGAVQSSTKEAEQSASASVSLPWCAMFPFRSQCLHAPDQAPDVLPGG